MHRVRGCLFLAVCLLLAGCAFAPQEDEPARSDPSPGDANQTPTALADESQTLLEATIAAMDPEGPPFAEIDGIQRLDMDTLADLGANRGTIEINASVEWGANGTLFFDQTARDVQVEAWCRTSGTIVRVNGTVYEARPPVGCAEQVSSTIPQKASRYERTSASSTDGRVQASWILERLGGDLELTVRGDGNLTPVHVEVDTPRRGLTFDVNRGPRDVLDSPTPTDRLPVHVSNQTGLAGRTVIWRVTDHQEHAPLDEIEVRVFDPDTGQRLATFDPANASEQRENNITFQFQDTGEGNLTTDDRFTLEHPGWDVHSDFELRVVDLWADKPLSAREIGL